MPGMFMSEVCIYLDEDYFRAHIDEGANAFGETVHISNRRLSSEWALCVPPGMSELGVTLKALDDDGRPFTCEYWFFGELER